MSGGSWKGAHLRVFALHMFHKLCTKYLPLAGRQSMLGHANGSTFLHDFQLPAPQRLWFVGIDFPQGTAHSLVMMGSTQRDSFLSMSADIFSTLPQEPQCGVGHITLKCFEA